MASLDTTTYKRTHRPQRFSDTSGKPHQGVYVPKNPGKVIGGEIIARSGWEMAFARWCDDNPQVVEWGCETVKIQYRNPSAINFEQCKKSRVSPDNPINWPISNYYPDFFIHLYDDSDPANIIDRKMMIEIKPKYQTIRPIPPPAGAKLKEVKRFNEAVRVYLQNLKKWEAANLWCKDHGLEFQVFTEETLQSLGLL